MGKNIKGSSAVIGSYSTCTDPSKWEIFICDLNYRVIDGTPSKTISIDHFILKGFSVGENVGSQGFAVIR